MSDKVQIHLVINKTLNKILEDLSSMLGRTKSDLIKEAIILLGQKYSFFTKEETERDKEPEKRIFKAIRKLNKLE